MANVILRNIRGWVMRTVSRDYRRKKTGARLLWPSPRVVNLGIFAPTGFALARETHRYPSSIIGCSMKWAEGFSAWRRVRHWPRFGRRGSRRGIRRIRSVLSHAGDGGNRAAFATWGVHYNLKSSKGPLWGGRPRGQPGTALYARANPRRGGYGGTCEDTCPSFRRPWTPARLSAWKQLGPGIGAPVVPLGWMRQKPRHLGAEHPRDDGRGPGGNCYFLLLVVVGTDDYWGPWPKADSTRKNTNSGRRSPGC